MGRTRRKGTGTPFLFSASPDWCPSSLARRSQKALSARDCDQEGPGSMRDDCSAPRAGIASLTTDSYSRRASRQAGQTARCSCSLFCSSSLSWPEVETAQSSKNSSWGPLGNNAPAPTMAKGFYHTASLPGSLPAEIFFRSFSRPR